MTSTTPQAASSIRELGAAYRSGARTPVQELEACLARIERDNGRVRAFSHIAHGPAMRMAHAAEDRITAGRDRGPLDGVPVGVKAVIAVDGMPLDAGSPAWAGHRATEDAAVVRALRDAGAVLVGMNTLDEFALSTVGAPAVNPRWPDRIAGGSSGGSAASVASGMCWASVGTDTGGSIRIPAACCAVAGLKPSRDRISTLGVVPMAASLDHVGPIARTVDDLAVLFSVLDGTADGGDPPVPALGQLRLGLAENLLNQAAPAVRDAFRRALAGIADRGATIVPVELPDPERVQRTHLGVVPVELAAYHREHTRHLERCGPAVREVIAAADRISAVDYFRARQDRLRLREEVDEALRQVDLLVLPTLAFEPPPLGADQARVGDRTEPITFALVALTSLFNHTGHPVVSAAITTTANGLPVGAQLVGAIGADHALLAAAKSVLDEGAPIT